MTLLDDAREMQGDLVALRREIHRDPEIGLALPRTQQRVLDRLEGLGLEITTGKELGSVVAVLRGGRASGRSVLLRADMDALPVKELTGLDFASREPVMHACGHDLHTSMLVGAAKLLSARAAELAGDVIFMFQPGEEGYDGARLMIEEGVLTAAGALPEAAYALHVTSSMFDTGVVATRPGPLMAAADTLHVRVVGTGGHASTPHLGRDPIAVAVEIVSALQTMVTRRFNVFDPVVLTVGRFQGGTQHNIIPDHAEFDATVRSFSPSSQKLVSESAVKLCRGIAEAHGLSAEVEWETLYPVTVNDDDNAGFVAGVTTELLGPDRAVTMRTPITGSEDFSRVLQAVPGAMSFLGATPKGASAAEAPFNHSAYAVFDESVLSEGAALYARFATSRLESPAPAPSGAGKP
jgi:amidohydrolase